MQNNGLSENQVVEAREKHGENKLREYKRKSFFKSFFLNLNDPIIRVLIIALFINVIFMFPNINWFESGGILCSIIMATMVSTISEYSSENAFERLKERNKNAICLVRRAGVVKEILTEEIVVGDVVIINTGMALPADGEIIEGEIYVDESSLTGESVEARKSANATSALQKKLLKGSVVSQGVGEMVVLKVGESTYYGQVARELVQDTRPSPLKHRLSALAKTISRLGYIFAVLIAIAYLFNVFVIQSNFDFNETLLKVKSIKFLLSELLNALTLGISIVVVAVPEGLPMMITVVLSSNMKKMMKDNVLVRKMVGIETAGSINLLFTDKTGTLTEGKLRVKEIYTPLCERVTLGDIKKLPKYEKYLALCTNYCNNSKYENGKILGSNATDRAILEHFHKIKVDASTTGYIPFDSSKKYSATRVMLDGVEYVLFKGAPERLLERTTMYLSPNGDIAPMDFHTRERISGRLNSLTMDAYRVIALGFKEGTDTSFDGITFVGMIALKDKIRKEVPRAIEQVKEAGVSVIMITGDNKNTAYKIASECGIISPRDRKTLVIEGSTLENMSDDEIAGILPQIAVIARALPSDKSRLVKIAQESGYIVGMTGDGINDASSLKNADVGFAMGSGTDVAKEAGDIIITDNNFASIVKAILYGRTIFNSIRRFIVFQLTMNLSAVGISLLGPFIGVESPVTITQMLWVNIIMDTLGALAFAREPANWDYMKEKPKPRDEKIISREMVGQIAWNGAYILALCIWFLKSEALPMLLTRGDEKYILCAFFASFIFMGVFVCFTSRTDRLNILSKIGKNKSFLLIMLLISAVQMIFIYFGGDLFRATPLDITDLAMVILISFSVVAFDLARKLVIKLFGRKNKIQTIGEKENVK